MLSVFSYRQSSVQNKWQEKINWLFVECDLEYTQTLFMEESAKLTTLSKSISNKTSSNGFFSFVCFILFSVLYAIVNMKKANAPSNFRLFLFFLSLAKFDVRLNNK